VTWHFDFTDGNTAIEVYDHTGALVLTVDNPDAPSVTVDAQGIPVEPDLRNAIVEGLIARGKVDLYAIRSIAEALTGSNFEEGAP
jgi:hypothetical protein